MSPIPSIRYHEAIFAVGIIKKVTGEKRQGGVVPTPPGRPRVKLGLGLVYSKTKTLVLISRQDQWCSQAGIETKTKTSLAKSQVKTKTLTK